MKRFIPILEEFREVKHLVRLTAIITSGTLMTRLTAMVFFIILARALTLQEYGLFRYLSTVAFMYAIFFSGIPTALTKFISSNREDKEQIQSYTSNAFLLVIGIFILLSLIILSYEHNAVYLILFLFAAMVDFFYLGFARGMLNYYKLTGFKLVENMVQLVLLGTAYILFHSISLVPSIIFYSIAGLASIIMLEAFKQELHLYIRPSWDKMVRLIKFSIPVTIGSVGWTVMFGINAIFINKFLGKEQVALFSVGETFVIVFTLLPSAISTLLLPHISDRNNREKMLKPIIYATIAVMLLSIMILILMMIFKEDIITLVFTSRYLGAASVILPLAIGQIMISIFQMYASALQGLDQPNVPSIIITVACILNIAGSYLLTRDYGIIGAAISNAVTSSIAAIVIIAIFYRRWKRYTYHKD